MSFYQLHFLDAVGHVERRMAVEFEGDAPACAYAAGLAAPQGVELWQGHTQVAAFPPWRIGEATPASTTSSGYPRSNQNDTKDRSAG